LTPSASATTSCATSRGRSDAILDDLDLDLDLDFDLGLDLDETAAARMRSR